MKNDLRYAEDMPIGTCMAYGGQHECEKWPELFPSPCCWLSCTELCGAACWRGGKVAEKCELFGKEAQNGSRNHPRDVDAHRWG